jgi:predicted DNA binding CopG/RHH family protein
MFNPEEKELLDSFERDEWQSVKGKEAESRRYREYARATFKKDRRVNIRISSKDLEALQKRALEEGIPYQTLIASILHKYAGGLLVERDIDRR